jgi:hypothetical protein
MAWTSAVHDGAAGRMITLLDNLLVAAHATWSIFDAGMPANEKVYRCLDAAADPPIEFYLHVFDNQVDFAKVLMYDSWDVGSHSYLKDTGCKVIYGNAAANHPYICKKNGGYYFSSQDHRFIYIDKAEWEANYVGMLDFPAAPRPFIQHPIMIVSSTAYAGGYNPLGHCNNVSTSVVARAMMGARGQGMEKIRPQIYAGAYRYYICADGGIQVRPSWIYDEIAMVLLGKLKNVMTLYTTDLLNNDDTVTIGGDVWRYVEGTDATRFACFIKQE